MSERAETGLSFGTARTLSLEEILDFGSQVAWPGVRELCGYDFLNESYPGDEYRIARRLRPAGLARLVVAARCALENNPETKKQEERRSLAIGIEELEPELTKGMLQAARKNKAGAEALRGRVRAASAWLIREYRFGELADRPFYIAHGHHLAGKDAILDWSDSSLANSKRDKSSGLVDGDRVNELDELFETSATDADCLLMRSILVQLGVPQEKIDRNFQ